MKIGRVRYGAAALLLIGCAGAVWAQNDVRGHWAGNIEGPAGPRAIEVDLDKTAGAWIGSMSIPAQGVSGLPLDPITFANGKVSFTINGSGGAAAFSGTLSGDGKTLDGTFAQGPQSMAAKLNRTGEAKVDVPKASPAVDAEFLGNWEGVVDMGMPLRLTLTIANGRAGAEATLVSLDQGNAGIPVNAITQKGTKLTMDVKLVGGGYTGDINKEGTQIDGTWTQLGVSTPLLLKKSK